MIFQDMKTCLNGGEYACLLCNKRPHTRWLKNSCKCYYIGHGGFLPNNHTFRKNKKAFNGCREVRSKPELLSRVEVLQQVKTI